MKKGEAKIEFFSNLEWIKKEYQAGLVVSKFLYNKAVIEKNIKMTYTQFNTYFNRYFNRNNNYSQSTNINQNLISENKKIEKEFLKNEPIKAKITTKDKKVFDAMYGKNFNDDDIL